MFVRTRHASLLGVLLLTTLAGCHRDNAASSAHAAQAHFASTCAGVWPSYWQDPAFAKTTMWQDQTITDTPESQNWTPASAAYTNPPFRLADAYWTGKADDPSAQTWRDSKFDALFKTGTSQAEKSQLSRDYGWALMHYIQEGNIDSGNVNTDWNLCANTHRQWFNMPFQTYNVLQGREFVHGLTREAPVVFSAASQTSPLNTTVWAVAFYNGNAAPTLASVWGKNGVANVPATNLSFAEGTVIGKLLFTTATAADLPFLANMPAWKANISMGGPTDTNPTFCRPSKMTMPQQSEACKRSPRTVRLLQFDVAVRDARAPNGWVFGTFVADGQEKAAETNPWNRISLLGLIWGDDTPPVGQLASQYPANPRANGFEGGVVDWDVAERLNRAGGKTVSMQPGHLGCNSRLNGPADNVASSCTSCHKTASVPDKNKVVPPLLAQFNSSLTPQCALPSDPPSGQKNAVTYAQMDGIYFAEIRCATPFSAKVNGICVLGANVPSYPDGGQIWVSTDFSLQMSGALVQWMEWQGDLANDKAAAKPPAIHAAGFMMGIRMKKAAAHPARVFDAEVPERGQ